ncbi:hypothetical protein GCM10027048_28100 [Hymenobacter coalescens]
MDATPTRRDLERLSYEAGRADAAFQTARALQMQLTRSGYLTLEGHAAALAFLQPLQAEAERTEQARLDCYNALHRALTPTVTP